MSSIAGEELRVSLPLPAVLPPLPPAAAGIPSTGAPHPAPPHLLAAPVTPAAVARPLSAALPQNRKIGADDFMYGTLLGEGAYARVLHCRLRLGPGSKAPDTVPALAAPVAVNSGASSSALGAPSSSTAAAPTTLTALLQVRSPRPSADFAVKIMEKRHIKKENKTHFVMMERSVLSRAAHPCIVRLCYTFQDAEYLYIVLELCRGGELLRVIRHYNELAALRPPSPAPAHGVGSAPTPSSSAFPASAPGLPLSCHALGPCAPHGGAPLAVARFYTAQLVCALEYLHTELHVVHRDLKPENVLLTERGHAKLTDFGTSKDEDAAFSDDRQDEFVGTAEYVSPEVLRDQPAHASADLWSLGCVLYQLLTGRPPLRGGSEYLTFQQILGYDARLTEGLYTSVGALPPTAATPVSVAAAAGAAIAAGAGAAVYPPAEAAGILPSPAATPSASVAPPPIASVAPPPPPIGASPQQLADPPAPSTAPLVACFGDVRIPASRLDGVGALVIPAAQPHRSGTSAAAAAARRRAQQLLLPLGVGRAGAAGGGSPSGPVRSMVPKRLHNDGGDATSSGAAGAAVSAAPAVAHTPPRPVAVNGASALDAAVASDPQARPLPFTRVTSGSVFVPTPSQHLFTELIDCDEEEGDEGESDSGDDVDACDDDEEEEDDGGADHTASPLNAPPPHLQQTLPLAYDGASHPPPTASSADPFPPSHRPEGGDPGPRGGNERERRASSISAARSAGSGRPRVVLRLPFDLDPWARDLVLRLMQPEPMARIGVAGWASGQGPRAAGGVAPPAAPAAAAPGALAAAPGTPVSTAIRAGGKNGAVAAVPAPPSEDASPSAMHSAQPLPGTILGTATTSSGSTGNGPASVAVNSSAGAAVSPRPPRRCGPVLLDYPALKSHPFFAGIDWATVADPKLNAPPYTPPLTQLPDPLPTGAVGSAQLAFEAEGDVGHIPATPHGRRALESGAIGASSLAAVAAAAGLAVKPLFLEAAFDAMAAAPGATSAPSGAPGSGGAGGGAPSSSGSRGGPGATNVGGGGGRVFFAASPEPQMLEHRAHGAAVGMIHADGSAAPKLAAAASAATAVVLREGGTGAGDGAAAVGAATVRPVPLHPTLHPAAPSPLTSSPLFLGAAQPSASAASSSSSAALPRPTAPYHLAAAGATAAIATTIRGGGPPTAAVHSTATYLLQQLASGEGDRDAGSPGGPAPKAHDTISVGPRAAQRSHSDVGEWEAGGQATAAAATATAAAASAAGAAVAQLPRTGASGGTGASGEADRGTPLPLSPHQAQPLRLFAGEGAVAPLSGPSSHTPALPPLQQTTLPPQQRHSLHRFVQESYIPVPPAASSSSSAAAVAAAAISAGGGGGVPGGGGHSGLPPRPLSTGGLALQGSSSGSGGKGLSSTLGAGALPSGVPASPKHAPVLVPNGPLPPQSSSLGTGAVGSGGGSGLASSSLRPPAVQTTATVVAVGTLPHTPSSPAHRGTGASTATAPGVGQVLWGSSLVTPSTGSSAPGSPLASSGVLHSASPLPGGMSSGAVPVVPRPLSTFSLGPRRMGAGPAPSNSNSGSGGGVGGAPSPAPPAQQPSLQSNGIGGGSSLFWVALLDGASGEHAVRWGPVVKRKVLSIFTSPARELVLLRGGPNGPRLLYLNPSSRSVSASIPLADTDLRVVLRSAPGAGAPAASAAAGLGTSGGLGGGGRAGVALAAATPGVTKSPHERPSERASWMRQGPVPLPTGAVEVGSGDVAGGAAPAAAALGSVAHIVVSTSAWLQSNERNAAADAADAVAAAAAATASAASVSTAASIEFAAAAAAGGQMIRESAAGGVRTGLASTVAAPAAAPSYRPPSSSVPGSPRSASADEMQLTSALLLLGTGQGRPSHAASDAVVAVVEALTNANSNGNNNSSGGGGGGDGAPSPGTLSRATPGRPLSFRVGSGALGALLQQPAPLPRSPSTGGAGAGGSPRLSFPPPGGTPPHGAPSSAAAAGTDAALPGGGTAAAAEATGEGVMALGGKNRQPSDSASALQRGREPPQVQAQQAQTPHTPLLLQSHGGSFLHLSLSGSRQRAHSDGGEGSPMPTRTPALAAIILAAKAGAGTIPATVDAGCDSAVADRAVGAPGVGEFAQREARAAAAAPAAAAAVPLGASVPAASEPMPAGAQPLHQQGAPSIQPVVTREHGIFDIHTGTKSPLAGRTFYLYDPLGQAEAWHDAILNAQAEALGLQLLARAGRAPPPRTPTLAAAVAPPQPPPPHH